MVEFELRVNPKQKVTWLPKEIVKAWGFRLKLMPNSNAGIVYPSQVAYADVVKSVEVLLEYLRQMAEIQRALMEDEDARQTSQGDYNDY
jgi:hypothetical protein